MRVPKAFIVGLCLVLACAGGGAIGALVVNQIKNGNLGQASVTTIIPKVDLADQATDNTIPTIVNRLTPGIVDITTNSTTYSYFGGPVEEEGAGTGMIIASNGYILTNNHVLSLNSQDITVTTSSGQQYPASVIATNPTKDLALIKINASGLSTVTLGDSDQVITGENVLAIGNALGQYQNTVDQGIISGLNRSVVASDESDSSSESLSGLLQTDAPINPGDSGGPLVDIKTGQVIGMDTAIAGDSQGIGFAIPINQAKAFVSPYVSSISS